MIAKIIAMGFVMNNYTYLRDPWNWLDVFVLIVSYISAAFTILRDDKIFYIASIRALAGLRAFKFINFISGLVFPTTRMNIAEEIMINFV